MNTIGRRSLPFSGGVSSRVAEVILPEVEMPPLDSVKREYILYSGVNYDRYADR